MARPSAQMVEYLREEEPNTRFQLALEIIRDGMPMLPELSLGTDEYDILCANLSYAADVALAAKTEIDQSSGLVANIEYEHKRNQELTQDHAQLELTLEQVKLSPAMFMEPPVIPESVFQRSKELSRSLEDDLGPKLPKPELGLIQ